MGNNEILDHFGWEVKKRREAKKLTTDLVAEYVGITRASISNIESGRQFISPEKLIKLCELLGCQVGELFPIVIPISFTVESEKVPVTTFKKVNKIVLTTSPHNKTK